jgi:AcrR family transcriptional regulator
VPRPTWTNLPAEKRERVLAAAMREFGEHGFSAGSLNVIARDAGVAKGSLFQYFDDKLDLFRTVCEASSDTIVAAVAPRVMKLAATGDLFAVLPEMLVVWVDYFADHPLERGVTAAINLEIDSEVRAAVRGVGHRHYLAVLRPLLEHARETGGLRPDSDIDVLLSLLILVLPHLALAPYVASLEPVLPLFGCAGEELRPVLERYGAVLRMFATVPAGAVAEPPPAAAPEV